MCKDGWALTLKEDAGQQEGAWGACGTAIIIHGCRQGTQTKPRGGDTSERKQEVAEKTLQMGHWCGGRGCSRQEEPLEPVLGGGKVWDAWNPRVVQLDRSVERRGRGGEERTRVHYNGVVGEHQHHREEFGLNLVTQDNERFWTGRWKLGEMTLASVRRRIAFPPPPNSYVEFQSVPLFGAGVLTEVIGLKQGLQGGP